MNQFIDLETKIAHQEVAIEELQQAVFEHHTTIERLEKSIKLLTQRFEAAMGGENQVGPGNEKPPHY